MAGETTTSRERIALCAAVAGLSFWPYAQPVLDFPRGGPGRDRGPVVSGRRRGRGVGYARILGTRARTITGRLRSQARAPHRRGDPARRAQLHARRTAPA